MKERDQWRERSGGIKLRSFINSIVIILACVSQMSAGVYNHANKL